MSTQYVHTVCEKTGINFHPTEVKMSTNTVDPEVHILSAVLNKCTVTFGSNRYSGH